MARRLLVVLIAALAATASLAAETDQASGFDYKAAQRTLSQPQPGTRQITQLLGQAAKLVTNPPQLARVAAEHNVSMDYELSGKLAIPLRHVIDVEAKVSNQSGGLSVGNSLLKYTASSNPSERSVSSTFELCTAVLPNGTVIRKVYTVELAYDNNRKYLEALGVDARNIPGASTVLSMVDHVLGQHREEHPDETPTTVTGAVVNELKGLVPQIFKSGAQFDKVTIGEGLVAEREFEGKGTPTVSVSQMQMERLKAGQSEGEGVKYSETSFSGGVSVDVPVNLMAHRTPGVWWDSSGEPTTPIANPRLADLMREVPKAGMELAFKVSTDPEKAPNPAKAELVTMIGQGMLKQIASRGIEQFAPVLEPNRLRQALEELDKHGQPDAADPNRIVGVDDPKVGGVRIYYDPGMLASDAPPADVARTLRRFMQQREQGQANFVVSSDAGEWHLRAVSLRELLRDPQQTTLGPLTRVRGFVAAPNGDFFLLGEVEEGKPPIDLDLLTVALRTVWRGKGFPYVSLDPDPADFSAPHKVRIGGVPDDLRDTEFIRLMIDADYAMKRITLGEDQVEAPGFASLCDLVQRNPANSEMQARLWLVPMPSRTADVWEYTSGNGRAVLFDSRVQVLTESMKRVDDYLIGGGGTDPLAVDEADSFTSHFVAIASQRDEFYRLNAVFDLSKLCAVLRERQVRNPLLDAMAARSVRQVEIPDHYAGIGPKQVAGTNVMLVGGADCRVRLSNGAFVKTDAIAGLLQAADGRSVTVAYPTTVALSTSEALGAQAEIVFDRGVAAMMKGDYPGCAKLMTQALDQDPNLAPAHAMRGLANFVSGQPKAALSDLNIAVAAQPQLQALRGLLRIYAGDVPGGLQDAAAAEKAFPDDETALTWITATYIYGFQPAKADATLNRLQRLDPLSPEAAANRTLLEILYKLGPAKARRRVELIRQVPLPIYDSYSEGLLAVQQLDLPTGIEKLKQCLHLITSEKPNAAVQSLYLREETEMALAIALSFQGNVNRNLGSNEEPQPDNSAQKYVTDLMQRHPDWPAVHLLQCMFVSTGDLDQLVAAFDLARKYKGKDDPLLSNIATYLGTNRVLPWVGCTLFYQAGQKKQDPLEMGDLLDRIIPVMGNGIEGRLFRALRDVLGIPPTFETQLKQVLLSMGDRVPAAVRHGIRQGVKGKAFFDLLDKYMPGSKIPEDDPKLKQVMKNLKDSKAHDVLRLRTEFEKLPDHLPSDPVTVWTVGISAMIYLPMEWSQGDPKIGEQMALKVLHMTDVEDLPQATWIQLGVFRMALMGLLGENFEGKFDANPRWDDMHEKLQNHTIGVAQVHAAIRSAQAEMEDTVRRAAGPFVTSFVGMGLHGPGSKEWALWDAATTAVPEIEDPAIREKEQQALDKWTAEIKSETTESGRLANLEKMLGAVRRPADVAVLSFLVKSFGLSAQMTQQESPAEAAQLSKIVTAIQSKIRGLQLPPPKRDWTKWSKGA